MPPVGRWTLVIFGSNLLERKGDHPFGGKGALVDAGQHVKVRRGEGPGGEEDETSLVPLIVRWRWGCREKSGSYAGEKGTRRRSLSRKVQRTRKGWGEGVWS